MQGSMEGIHEVRGKRRVHGGVCVEEHMHGGMGGTLYLLGYVYLNVPVNLWYDF